MRLTAIIAAVLLGVGAAQAGAVYAPPAGCQPLATLRLSNCIVRQVARCADRLIQDHFQEGVFTGRSTYSHPALFVRFDGADGYIAGHVYGPGTPAPDEKLAPGGRYSYSRDVYRNAGAAEPGDTGTEVLEVGDPTRIDLDGRSYQVLDLRFEVSEPKTGYRYRERAFLLDAPRLTIGVLGAVTLPGGGRSDFSTIPESISLEGDPGFLSNDPALSCLPSS